MKNVNININELIDQIKLNVYELEDVSAAPSKEHEEYAEIDRLRNQIFDDLEILRAAII